MLRDAGLVALGCCIGVFSVLALQWVILVGMAGPEPKERNDVVED